MRYYKFFQSNNNTMWSFSEQFANRMSLFVTAALMRFQPSQAIQQQYILFKLSLLFKLNNIDGLNQIIEFNFAFL